MTKKPLFLDTEVKLQKIAMETQLSDNSEQWQQECASELYRQAPYVSNYATDVILDKVDAERGYAYGKATLKNKYDTPQPDKDNRAVNIPIIVRDKMLKPFDIYTYESKSFPLTEQRISQALFKNQPLELTDRKPSDKMMTYNMMPPTRSHLNSVVSNTGFGKFASNRSLLDEIIPTLSQYEVDKFMSKISSDLSLQNAFVENPAFSSAVIKIGMASPMTKAAAISETSNPTCIQLKKISHDTFILKTANVNAFYPTERELDVDQVADMFLEDKAYKMTPGQTITGSSLGALQTQKPTDFKPVNGAGTYQVRDEAGNDTYGAVLPMVNWSGERSGDQLFVNTDAYAVQEKIAGKKIANEMALPESLPHGYGAFYDPQENVVTEPINIKFTAGYANDSSPPNYIAHTTSGKAIQVQRNKVAHKIAHVINNSYIIPERMQWLPLPNKEIEVKSDLKDNVADYNNINSTIEIRNTGDEYSISGRPVEKIGHTQFLDREEAEFILGTMGIGAEKLAEADKKKYVKVAGARTIIPISEVIDRKDREAIKLASKFPWHLKKDLTKEAAVLQDEDTVDKVLSLGFLNKDNIRNFAGYLPELERTTNKLADLLFASRCGLSTVPETAVESAMKNTDEILSGLRSLQEQEAVS